MTNPENENDFSIAEKNAKPNHEIIPHEIYMQTMIKDSSCSSPSQNSHDNPNWALRKKIFYLFLYVTIFTNYDTGVIPAALINIEKELELSYFQQGLLGSLPNFGISFASFLVSYVIGKFKAKTILFAAIVSNIMFCILLALSKNLWALYFSRFFMGFTQSFWIIYGPVWCNYFSPRERQATWLGFLQGFSPLGIMVGYLATGFIINLRPENYSWRLSILIQAALEFPIIFILYFINNSDLDMFEHKTNIESVPIHPKLTAWAQVKQLICNNIFMCASFLVCISFFVVVGIQFWGTSYMIITMDTSPHNAMIIYAFITITAPILGVVASGFVVDYLGGYKGANRLVALKMIFAFSVLCVLISVPLSFIYNVFLFAPLLWLQIFFGGCNIPAGIGIVVDSVEPNLQAYASSFSQFIYNICGYFLSPIFSASVMDSFDNRVEGMKWGFRINEFMTIFALILALSMLIITNRTKPDPLNKEKDRQDLNGTDYEV